MVEATALGEGLLEQTLAVLHRCGAERDECVVLWTGPLDRPALLNGLLHPAHSSGLRGYEISPVWLNRTFLELGAESRQIRAQVHSHPRRAFHSATDDAYPVIHTPGFLSLVIPRFARPPQDLGDAHLARLETDGSWSSLDPRILLAGAVA